MANLNTKQTADFLLGKSKLIYRINLDIPQSLRIQKDLVGLGNPYFMHEGNADTNPQSNPSASGMNLSVERSATTPSNASVGYSVAVNVQNLSISMPNKFVLMGGFSDLNLDLKSPPGVQSDTFAAGVTLNYGNSAAGTTVQVRDNTARSNFPGTSARNSFQFSNAFYTQVISPGSPHHFSIVVFFERTNQLYNGQGLIYAGDQQISSQSFTVTNSGSTNIAIDQFRFGLGVASGSLCRASLMIHDVEIWFPD